MILSDYFSNTSHFNEETRADPKGAWHLVAPPECLAPYRSARVPGTLSLRSECLAPYRSARVPGTLSLRQSA
ncbi:MAG: hypothetical protein KDA51_01510, partial [Planctomycetales bacterium]|nr:hypothetical protein [Planctomycetales bacterium]